MFKLTDCNLTKYEEILDKAGLLTEKATRQMGRLSEQERAEAVRTADRIARLLPDSPPEYISDLTGAYSTLYMAGHRRMPDAQLIAAQRRRLIEAWHRQSRQTPLHRIEESQIYGMLQTAALQPLNDLTPDEKQLYAQLRDNWVAILQREGTFPGILTHERYRRLTLLTQDRHLAACFKGNEAAARKAIGEWYEKNRLQEADRKSASKKLQKAYTAYLAALRLSHPEI